MYRFLMALGIIQETKVLDIEEVDPEIEMKRQIDHLISRGLQPEVILADTKSYNTLVQRFDMTKSYGLSLPRDMGGVNIMQVYTKKLKLTKEARTSIGTLFDYVLNNAPFATTVDIRNDVESQNVTLTWAAYCGIDLIVCPWVEGVMVLPSLYIQDDRTPNLTRHRRVP